MFPTENAALAQQPVNPENSYSQTEAGSVKLAVLNIRGQEVMILQDADNPPGKYEVQWNGKDQAGNPVSTGVYFCRL